MNRSLHVGVFFLCLACFINAAGFAQVPAPEKRANSDQPPDAIPSSQSSVVELISRLETNPNAEDVSSAANLLAKDADDLRLEPALRKVFNSGTGRPLVLHALAQHSVQEFDIDIAGLLPGPSGPLPPDFDQVLAAAAVSGGGLTNDLLINLIGTQSDFLSGIRMALARTAFHLNKSSAIATALNYYARIPGDLASSDGASLVELIKELSDNRLAVLQLLGPFEFATSSWQKPQNQVQLDVLSAIEKTLLQWNEPAMRIELLHFTLFDNAALSGPAKDADYLCLEEYPWLIPDGSFFPGLTTEESTRKTLRKYRIGFPRNVSLIGELKQAQLRGVELKAASEGALTPQSQFSRTLDETVGQQNLFASAVLDYIGKEYNLDISGFSATVDPKLVARNLRPDYRYISTRQLEYAVSGAVAQALVRTGMTANDSKSLASYLVARELERRALVLLAMVGAVRTAGAHGMKLHLEQMDSEFDQLSETPQGKGSLHTTVVHSVQVENKASLSRLKLPSSCQRVAFQVSSRQLSFDQGLYRELLKITCGDTNYATSASWTGSIPLPLLAPLERHPRLLDFSDISLAARELLSESPRTAPLMDDIDVVRLAPIISLNYLSSAIETPDVPWNFVRDSMIVDSDLSQSLKLLGFKSAGIEATPPLPLPVNRPKLHFPPGTTKEYSEGAQKLIDSGMPGMKAYFLGSFVATSTDEYNKYSDIVKFYFQTVLQYRIGRKAAEKILPTVQAIDTKKPCDPLDVLCLTGVLVPDDQAKLNAKNSALANLNGIVEQGKFAENFLEAWDPAKLEKANIVRVQLREMVVSPSLQEFTGTYAVLTATGEIRYVVVEGQISGLPDPMKSIIRKDPSFLSTYNLDLGGMSQDAGLRLVLAAQRVLRQDSGRLFLTDLLNRTGFYPLAIGSVEVKAPFLYKSQTGRIVAAEIAAFNRIFDFVKGGSLPSNGVPRADFGTEVKRINTAVAELAEKKSSDEAQPIIDQINAQNQQQKPWSIGVTATFNENGSPVYSFSYSNGTVGIGISTNFSSDLFFRGLDNGNSLPLFGVSLVSQTPSIPTSSTLDTAIAFFPTDLAVAGTSYVPLHGPRVLVASLRSDADTQIAASAPISPAVPPGVTASSPGDRGPQPDVVLTTSVPTGWNSIPPLLGPGPWKDTGNLNEKDRTWLFSLIYVSMPALSEPEFKAVIHATQTGFFPDQLVTVLSDRYKQMVEQERINTGEWFRTVYVPHLVSAGLTDAARAREMERLNAESSGKFQHALSSAKMRLGTDNVMVDGMPAIRLFIQDDYTVMMYEYSFLLVDGEIVVRNDVFDTPFWLLPHIKSDPNGHWPEKLTAIGLDSMINNLGRASETVVGRTEVKRLRDAEDARKFLAERINAAGTTVQDKLQEIIREYFADLFNWEKRQPPGPNVAEPFIPKSLGTPMLNFFPPPYEWWSRRNESVYQVLLYQGETEMARRIRQGDITIVRPK